MPLEPGSSDKVVGKNIAELERSGYKPKQAIAISLHKAGKSKPMSKSPPRRPAGRGR